MSGIFVMTRISTIPNPAYNADAPPPTLLSRAVALFKRDLPYRFLNFINCKCKVAAPRGGDRNSPEYREQAYLRKLSKGRMNPLDAMLGLVRVTEIEGYKPFGKLDVSTYQARRMLENLSQESIPILSQHIQEIEKNFLEKATVSTRQEGPSPQEAGHLEFLKKLRDNHKCLAEKLMACARYEEEFLYVGDGDKVSSLEAALESAWHNIPKGKKTSHSPSDLIQKMIVQCKNELRGVRGTKEQKEFAKNLNSFHRSNEVSTGPLEKMLTQALRKVGIDDPHEIAQKRMVQLVKVPKDIQAKLLPPLPEAMWDVIDGVGSARHDLAQALKDIGQAAQAAKGHITVLDSMVVAIKIRNPGATDQQFEEAAYEHLSKVPKDRLIYFMAHADTIKSSEKTELVQNALRRLANTEVLDKIDEYFQDYGDKKWDAARDKIAALDHNELAIIADFFDRNPWISDFFQRLAAVKESAMSIAWIIQSVNELSHRQLGLTTPTSLSEAQKSDRERFLQIYDKNEGPAWHALYTFFEIPDEPAELPG
jgi:hypothetical protein